jgi:hypothetical protein
VFSLVSYESSSLGNFRRMHLVRNGNNYSSHYPVYLYKIKKGKSTDLPRQVYLKVKSLFYFFILTESSRGAGGKGENKYLKNFVLYTHAFRSQAPKFIVYDTDSVLGGSSRFLPIFPQAPTFMYGVFSPARYLEPLCLFADHALWS